MPLGTVALVGSPSSGKSTIFNRIVGDRRSIVEETPGITRDRLYSKANWLGHDFTIIDTGGLQIKDAPFQEEIRAQVEVAIKESDLIVFVVDGKLGLTSNDRYIASLLQKTNKPIILVCNKIDSIQEIANQSEFYALGMGEPMVVSGAHGIGIGDLLDEIIKKLPQKDDILYDNAISFSLIGRPNVGKSSLANCILKQDRSIVSNISGTTRDSVDTPFSYEGQNFVAIDTAGLVKRGKIYEAIDKYAALRAVKAVERSEIALLVLDGETGIVEQDKHVSSLATDSKKAVIIIVNKWDMKKKDENKNEYTEQIRKEFKFLEYAPILFVSAKTKEGTNKILPMLMTVHEAFNRRIPTSLLNQIIREAQDMNPSPYFHHNRLKISYASQVAVAPPTFVMFCNDPKSAHFSYTRYIENQIREKFDFSGTPINIIYRFKK